MRHHLTLILAGYSFLFLTVFTPLWEAQAQEREEIVTHNPSTYQIIDHKAQEDLSGVLQLVDDYVQSGITPTKIALVFDVDGTLTDWSSPGDHIVKERYGSTAIVLKILEMGVHVAVSSAWNNLNETLDRLDTLGFTQALKIADRNQIAHGYYQSMTYHQLGLVASVQDPKVDNTYYRQKAYAPYIIYDLKTMNQIEKVIFADDSSGNIKYFKKDVRNHHLYPKANQMDYFYLTEIKGIKSESSEETPEYSEEEYYEWDEK